MAQMATWLPRTSMPWLPLIVSSPHRTSGRRRSDSSECSGANIFTLCASSSLVTGTLINSKYSNSSSQLHHIFFPQLAPEFVQWRVAAKALFSRSTRTHHLTPAQRAAVCRWCHTTDGMPTHSPPPLPFSLSLSLFNG